MVSMIFSYHLKHSKNKFLKLGRASTVCFVMCAIYFSASGSWSIGSTMLGSPRRDTPETVEEKVGTITKSVKSILEAVGEDPEREGLARTPERYAKAMLFFTKGYTQSLKGIYQIF